MFSITDHYEVHLILLQKLWNLLSSDSGILLTEVRDDIDNNRVVRDWVKFIEKEGIDVCSLPNLKPRWNSRDAISLIRLVKYKNSPDTLPIFKM